MVTVPKALDGDVAPDASRPVARRRAVGGHVDRPIVTAQSAAPQGDPFEAIGDGNRREILRLLSQGDKPVHEIAAALPISRPAVSRHLKLLKNAGLVAEHADGNRRIYHLDDDGLQVVQDYLQRVWGEAAVRFRLVAENTAEPRR